ncbi:MAG: hypothetical protein R3C14_31020 [Caldilineaceae bacterium]
MTTNVNSERPNGAVVKQTRSNKRVKRVPSKIILRAWPGIIFMWPTGIAALIAGFLTLFSSSTNDMRELSGTIFLVIFTINLVVVTFDFPRSTSLTLLLAGIALLWLFVELNRRFNIITPLQEFVERLELVATSDFYFTVFVVYLLLFIGMFVMTRLSYWEITSNEILYHKGLMQDVRRYSTDGLQYSKRITDFFEYLLAGSGRLILDAPGMENPVVLNNVVGIHRITEDLDLILEVKRVAVSNEEIEIVPETQVIS